MTQKTKYWENPEKYRQAAKDGIDRRWAGRLLRQTNVSITTGTKAGRGIVCNLTSEQLEKLWEEQDGRCYFTGVAMVPQRRSLFTVSLDRLDNSRGYEINNVALVSKAANLARNTSTEHEFCQWLDEMVKNFRS